MSCFVSMQIEIDIEMVGVLPICIVKPIVSSVGPSSERNKALLLSSVHQTFSISIYFCFNSSLHVKFRFTS